MNGKEIESMIMPFQKVSIFKGVFPCDKLPKKIDLPAALVINLSPSNNGGSHWVGLYISKKGGAYYFDSYGYPPTNPYIVYFIRMHSKKLVFNRKQLQHLSSRKCGKFVCVFVLTQMYDYDFGQITKRLSSNLRVNELVLENVFTYLKNIATASMY